MVVAVAKALEAGAEGIICASTGNTAASAAAYAARAGISAVVLCPAGAIAAAKQAQSRVVGARVLEVRGQLRGGARAAASSSPQRGIFVLVNSLNPDRIEGQKTAAFEIVEQLGRAARGARAALRRRRQPVRLREGLRRGGRRAAPGRRRRRASARRRSPRRSGSSSRRTWPRSTRSSRAGAPRSSRSPTSEITDAWLELAEQRGASSASPPRRPGSPRSPTSSSSRARPSSACSPATGSRTPARSTCSPSRTIAWSSRPPRRSWPRSRS